MKQHYVAGVSIASRVIASSLSSLALLGGCQQRSEPLAPLSAERPNQAAAPASTEAAATEPPFSRVQIETVEVAPGVHMLIGAGGNIGVSSGEDGVLIVDDQYAPLTDKVRRAIDAIHPGPIRFVVNTHFHGDHTGGNQNLGATGSIIVAHENVRRRMSAEQQNPFFGFKHEAGPQPRTTVPAPADALPVVTFSEDVSFHWNGDELHVIHLQAAHTDGDAVVHFENANVFHLGDLYFSSGFPFIDVISGGSVDGVIAGVDRVLALANDATRLIAGHGPLSTKRDLAAYRDMLKAVRDRVHAAIMAGKTLGQTIADRPTRDWDDTLGKGFVNGEQFTAFVYASLARH